MSFWEHTYELVRRLKVVLYTLVISTVLMMVFPANISFFRDPLGSYEPLISVILGKIREQVLPKDVTLIGETFVNPIELYLVASFFFGLVITAPVLAYEIYKFVDPALYPHERRGLYPFLTSFAILFIAGLIFGYFVLVPYGLMALLPFFKIVGAEPYISVTSFYYFVFILTILTGIVFTFPIFLTLFVRFGVLQTATLTKNRKYVYFGLLILVFLVTPGEGGLANFMLLAVMILLFEAGIFFAKRYEKKGEIRRPRWFEEKQQCKFCRKDMPANVTFCPHCGKSQK